MKRLFILLLLSTVIFKGGIFSQAGVTGTVVTLDGHEPVEFCAVVVSGKPFGVYTNSKGQFLIPASVYNVGDTIRFSYIGYRSQFVKVGPASAKDIQVELAADAVSLAEIEVKRDRAIEYKKEKSTLGQWKKRTSTSFAPSLFDKYLSFAQYVPNDNKATEVYLEEIGIYLSGISSNRSKFILDVYSLDPSCNCPGESLLSSTKIVSDPKKGWNDVDIERDLATVSGDGFFIVYIPIFNDEYAYSSNAVGYVNSVAADRYPIFIKEGGSDWMRDDYMNRRLSSMLVRSTAVEFSVQQSSGKK